MRREHCEHSGGPAERASVAGGGTDGRCVREVLSCHTWDVARGCVSWREAWRVWEIPLNPGRACALGGVCDGV